MRGSDRPFVPLVERAIELAAEWHDGTYRKGRWRPPPFDTATSLQVPTMAHVTSVATIVSRAGWPETVIAAAYLHDILEDRNADGDSFSHDLLIDEVGEEVTRFVETVSENSRESVSKESSWRKRKEAYLEQIIRGPAGAIAISLADKIHNLWTINQNLEQKIDPFVDGAQRRGLSAGPDAQLWFHRAVLEASDGFEDRRLIPLRNQLQEEIQRFQSLMGQENERI